MIDKGKTIVYHQAKKQENVVLNLISILPHLVSTCDTQLHPLSCHADNLYNVIVITCHVMRDTISNMVSCYLISRQQAPKTRVD